MLNFENIVKKEYSEIDKSIPKIYAEIYKKSENKKRAVDFIVDVIQQDEDKFMKVFLKNKLKSSVSKYLFSKTKKTIERIERISLIWGVPYYSIQARKRLKKSPECRLGWFELKNGWTGKITDEGLKIVNSYRKTRDYSPIKKK